MSSDLNSDISRALQSAGVRTCVTTLWKVDDATTARLMSEFYRSLTREPVDVLRSEFRHQPRAAVGRRTDLRDDPLEGRRRDDRAADVGILPKPDPRAGGCPQI